MKIINLPFTQNLRFFFGNMADYQWSIWLDSTVNNTNHNDKNRRYNIIAGFPYKTIVTNIDTTIVTDFVYNDNLTTLSAQQTKTSNNSHNPFSLLNSILHEISSSHSTYNSPDNNNDDIPFWHGAIGYFGYDLNQLLFKQLKKQAYNNIPLMAIGIYSWALITDHKLEKTYIAFDPRFIDQTIIDYIINFFTTCNNTPNPHQDKISSEQIATMFNKDFFKPLVTKHEYQENFYTIKRHIKDGNCYQVNYAIPFCGQLDNDNISSWDVYQYLRGMNPNPFGCYFNCTHDANKLAIMSFSPERFIKINDGVITTQPIKGTRKHIINDTKLNQHNINDLLNSEKDRAENIMITDLMRNDLNKYCVPGTVRTLEICELYTFPTVHHLISTVCGKIDQQYSSLDVFQGCFPGGSITGAPKIKAMEIIQQLENNHDCLTRYVYCGCIGYINIDNKLDMNIAIRTVIQNNQDYYYCAGGGIVADSDYQGEYDEILSKLIKTC